MGFQSEASAVPEMKYKYQTCLLEMNAETGPELPRQVEQNLCHTIAQFLPGKDGDTFGLQGLCAAFHISHYIT